MTALHSAFAPSFHGHGPFDTMPEQAPDQDWQQQQQQHQHQPNQTTNSYIPHMPMLTNQWAPQAQPQSNTPQQHHQQLIGMAAMDRRFFHDDAQPYMAYSTTGTSNNLISPCYPTEGAWSDMDVTTESNFDSPQEPLETYIPTQPIHSHLQPPLPLPSNNNTKHAHAHAHAHAPCHSPHNELPDPLNLERPSLDRPPIGPRSNTEPVKTYHAKSSKSTPTIKASASDESDDDFVPSESNLNLNNISNSNNSSKPPAAASNRGRKRQRIPHTAVERRYRENLNAHLERLRQTVPALASRRASAGFPLTSTNSNHNATTGHRASEPNPAPLVPLLSDGAKPSKCEILNGAIEHIGVVERENANLRDEVKELRARVEDLQRWYSATLRSAGGGGGYTG